MFINLMIVLNVSAMHQLALQQHADLAFGCRQVEQVICDRPEMGEIISQDPTLRQTLIRQFAGESGRGRIYWEYQEPTSGRPAEHFKAYAGYPVMVRISKRASESPIDKCASLVFELLNFTLDNEIEMLINTSAAKRKSRKEFVTQCVRLEYEALNRAGAYFDEHSIAGASSERDPFYWALGYHEEFSEYLKDLDEKSEGYDPREYFGQLYDEVVLQR